MLVDLRVQLLSPLRMEKRRWTVEMQTRAGRVDRVRGEVLDVVLGGELPLGLRDGELVELQLGLLAEVRPVDQEQDPLGVRVLDEPVADVRGGERLARAGRHLDERPGPVLGQ